MRQADPDAQLQVTSLTLPRVAAHVSRVVGEVTVGAEVVRLRWRGSTGAQLSSSFDALGGARRVALNQAMAALLDEAEDHTLLLRRRETVDGAYPDVLLLLQ